MSFLGLLFFLFIGVPFSLLATAWVWRKWARRQAVFGVFALVEAIGLHDVLTASGVLLFSYFFLWNAWNVKE